MAYLDLYIPFQPTIGIHMSTTLPTFPNIITSNLVYIQVGALCFQIGIPVRPTHPYWRTCQEFVSQAMQLPLPHWVSISSLHAAATSQFSCDFGTQDLAF